jgi:hypothetical protein
MSPGGRGLPGCEDERHAPIEEERRELPIVSAGLLPAGIPPGAFLTVTENIVSPQGLPFKNGEVVSYIKSGNNGWTLVKNKMASQCWLPTYHLQFHAPPPTSYEEAAQMALAAPHIASQQSMDATRMMAPFGNERSSSRTAIRGSVSEIWQLRLALIKAQYLPKSLAFSNPRGPDALVTFDIPGQQQKKSKTIQNSQNPEWNEEFAFEVCDEKQDLVLRVWDSVRATKNDLIGEVRLKLADMSGKSSTSTINIMKQGKYGIGTDSEKATVTLFWSASNTMSVALGEGDAEAASIAGRRAGEPTGGKKTNAVVGIALGQGENNSIIVAAVKPGAPAHRSRMIAPGDQLLRVDGQPVGGQSLKAVVTRMCGSVGSSVSLVVLKRSGDELEVVLRREQPLPSTPNSFNSSVGYAPLGEGRIPVEDLNRHTSFLAEESRRQTEWAPLAQEAAEQARREALEKLAEAEMEDTVSESVYRAGSLPIIRPQLPSPQEIERVLVEMPHLSLSELVLDNVQRNEQQYGQLQQSMHQNQITRRRLMDAQTLLSIASSEPYKMSDSLQMQPRSTMPQPQTPSFQMSSPRNYSGPHTHIAEGLMKRPDVMPEIGMERRSQISQYENPFLDNRLQAQTPSFPAGHMQAPQPQTQSFQIGSPRHYLGRPDVISEIGVERRSQISQYESPPLPSPLHPPSGRQDMIHEAEEFMAVNRPDVISEIGMEKRSQNSQPRNENPFLDSKWRPGSGHMPTLGRGTGPSQTAAMVDLPQGSENMLQNFPFLQHEALFNAAISSYPQRPVMHASAPNSWPDPGGFMFGPSGFPLNPQAISSV